MDPQTAIHELRTPRDLTILDITHPFLHPDTPDEHKRASNASDASSRDPASASASLLAADLAHYRDLFTKLRFSYLEQVTKENFLKAITLEEPDFVSAAENAELEEKLLRADKAGLKERKEEVANLLRELEEQGRSLATRHEDVQLRTTQLSSLPSEITNLEQIIADLQSAAQPKSSNPSLALPLQPTRDLLAQREQESADLDRQIELLRANLPAKRAEVERLRDELTPLQARKIKAVQDAQEARRRRQDGGTGDELEEKGRWLRGQDAGLRGMLEV